MPDSKKILRRKTISIIDLVATYLKAVQRGYLVKLGELLAVDII